jgi:hypothetical protein
MDNIARRKFCGMAILSFPLFCTCAKGSQSLFGQSDRDQSDPIIDFLADEMTRIAAEGAQNGFKAEHFRRLAGVIRTFDVRLEEKGTNRELNNRLDDDDFHKLNPTLAARKTVDYWEKHGVHLSQDDLVSRLTMDPMVYRQMKKNIKKQGGVRVLHTCIADALERKAREQGNVVFKGAAVLHNGRVSFTSRNSSPAKFLKVQFDDPSMFLPGLGMSLDCFCRALVVEGALLMLACILGCVPCCEPGAFLLAFEKLLEGLGLCSPDRC